MRSIFPKSVTIDQPSLHVELFGPSDVLAACVAPHVKGRHDSLNPLARLGAFRQLRDLRRIIVGRVVFVQHFSLRHTNFSVRRVLKR